MEALTKKTPLPVADGSGEKQTTNHSDSFKADHTEKSEEVQAFLTVFTSIGLMRKQFSIQDGELKKDSPGLLFEGAYKKKKISLKSLSERLPDLGKKQCICLGVSVLDEGTITTLEQHNKAGNPSNPIPRSKKHFKFVKGEPAFMLIDIDAVSLSLGEVLGVLGEIMPELNAAGCVVAPSSSAGIKYNGKPYKSTLSCHIYFIAGDGSDIPRFMQTLFHRLWLDGHGFIKISRAGSMLVRGLIDKTVASPERIIYEAAPILLNDIIQERKEPEHVPGGMLATFNLPNPSTGEEKELKQLIDQAKDEARPEAEKVKAVYKKEEIKKLVKEGLSAEQAEKVVLKRLKHILDDNDLLYFQHETGAVSVTDILNNPDNYNGKSLADPLEPEYDGWSKTKAIFYFNEGKKPIIKSYAHGEQLYRFARYDGDFDDMHQWTAPTPLSASGDVSTEQEYPFDLLKFPEKASCRHPQQCGYKRINNRVAWNRA